MKTKIQMMKTMTKNMRTFNRYNRNQINENFITDFFSKITTRIKQLYGSQQKPAPDDFLSKVAQNIIKNNPTFANLFKGVTNQQAASTLGQIGDLYSNLLTGISVGIKNFTDSTKLETMPQALQDGIRNFLNAQTAKSCGDLFAAINSSITEIQEKGQQASQNSSTNNASTNSSTNNASTNSSTNNAQQTNNNAQQTQQSSDQNAQKTDTTDANKSESLNFNYKSRLFEQQLIDQYNKWL